MEAALSDATRAIITVDLYGDMPDYARLSTIADKHDLALIEDAAQAIGSTQGGRLAGGFGLASTFSFHGTKTLTTGEGGMWVSDDEALYRRVRVLCDHGRQPGDISLHQWRSGVQVQDERHAGRAGAGTTRGASTNW